MHHALPHARTKRSVRHIRKLKSDRRVAGAVQQTGFLRVKRTGLPGANSARAKRDSPWASLRAALDEDIAREEGRRWQQSSDVVHDENYYNRLQHSASHRYYFTFPSLLIRILVCKIISF